MGRSELVGSRRHVALGKKSPSQILITERRNMERRSLSSECVTSREIRWNRKDRKALFQMEQIQSFIHSHIPVNHMCSALVQDIPVDKTAKNLPSWSQSV